MRRQADDVEPAGVSTSNDGLHVTVRPVEGLAPEDSVRFPVKRLRLVRETVDVVESPTLRVTELGAEIPKSTTITEMIVVWWDNESLTPVTVAW